MASYFSSTEMWPTIEREKLIFLEFLVRVRYFVSYIPPIYYYVYKNSRHVTISLDWFRSYDKFKMSKCIHTGLRYLYMYIVCIIGNIL